MPPICSNNYFSSVQTSMILILKFLSGVLPILIRMSSAESVCLPSASNLFRKYIQAVNDNSPFRLANCIDFVYYSTPFTHIAAKELLLDECAIFIRA